MSRIPLRAARLLPLIASPIDGEALAACRAFERALNAAGYDLHDVVAAIVAPPEPPMCSMSAPSSHFDLARAVRDIDGGSLSQRERIFVSAMCRLGDRRPSEMQAAWLRDLFTRLQRRAA